MALTIVGQYGKIFSSRASVLALATLGPILPSLELNRYRLYTEEKVSMGFIIPSDEVARLINPIETVPRCLAGFYYVKIAKQQLRSYSTV